MKDGGPEYFDRFKKDLLQLEDICKLHILPEDQLSKLSQVFTNQEAYQYLVTHGKHNKKC